MLFVWLLPYVTSTWTTDILNNKSTLTGVVRMLISCRIKALSRELWECFYALSIAQFIVARTRSTNYYYLALKWLFVLPHTFTHFPFHNLRSTTKKINSTASLSFYYASLTFYMTLKLRKCAKYVTSEMTSWLCHLPPAFFSLLTTKTRYCSTGLEDFKLREFGCSYFSLHMCSEAPTREIQSLEYWKTMQYICDTLATR